MAKRSRTIAAELESFRRVGTAAANNKSTLPKEAQGYASELGKRTASAQKLNSEQEKLKGQLKKVTAALNAEMKAGTTLRTKVIRLAEVAFGSNAPELKEFRAQGEG